MAMNLWDLKEELPYNEKGKGQIYFHIRKDWVKRERKKQLYRIKVDGSIGFIKGIGIQRGGNKWIWK